LDDVGDDLGERAVVADGPGQDELDTILDARIHDAGREQAGFDRLTDAAYRADPVDRAQVVFVTGVRGLPAIQGHPKRSPVQRILDVVRRQGVAGEEDVDVATLDEAAKVLAGAGVDDGWPGDEEVLLPGTTALVHPDRRLANGSPARTLTR